MKYLEKQKLKRTLTPTKGIHSHSGTERKRNKYNIDSEVFDKMFKRSRSRIAALEITQNLEDGWDLKWAPETASREAIL